MASLLEYEGPAVLFEHVEDKQGALIDVSFAGMMPNEKIELSVLQLGEKEGKIGTVKGKLLGKLTERLGLLPDAPQVTVVAEPSVRLRFKSQAGTHLFAFALSADKFDKDEGCAWQIKACIEGLGAESPTITLARSRRQPELFDEHDANVQHVGYEKLDHTTPERVDAAGLVGGATYDWHAGHHVKFYHDGSVDAAGSDGAFHDMLAAIKAAKHFVFVVDWSFQPLFCPGRAALPLARSHSIGSLLLARAFGHKDLLVAIHTWNHTSGAGMIAPDGPNDDAEATFERLAKDFGQDDRPDNLLWRATSRTGTQWSHHQKFVVLDAEAEDGRRELKVFWGGLDLTQGRFDWPEHVIDPAVAKDFRTVYKTADGKESAHDWYNAEFPGNMDVPRQPWHDIHGQASGPVAWDFVREFVGRWNLEPSFGGDIGDTGSDHIQKVWQLLRKLYQKRDVFVQQYEGKRKGRWSMQMYRSLWLEHWGPPTSRPKDELDRRLYAQLRTDRTRVSEQSIRRAYHHNIARAEHFIYIENQYFLGSGRHWGRLGGGGSANAAVDNEIPERIVNRILVRAAEGKPFHVYIVMPMFPEGDPVGQGGREVRLSEWRSIEYMVQRLDAEKAKIGRWDKYLSFYFPAKWSHRPAAKFSKAPQRVERVREHMRYMIYVHSKLMIVDDRYALFGSCNLNDRGLSGVGDSEVACGVWPAHGEASAAEDVKKLRKDLWLEHFGAEIANADDPASSTCVDDARRRGDDNYIAFRTMAAPTAAHLCRLPLTLGSNKGLTLLAPKLSVPDNWQCLPDAPATTPDWQWPSNGADFLRWLGAAE